MGLSHFLRRPLRFLLLAAAIPPAELEAQQLPLVSYNRATGLLSDYVTCIAQDREGFLWFGSDRGLSRYDGREFTQYTAADGLPDPFIGNLFADDDGAVWASTHQGGLVRVSAEGLTTFDTADGLPSNEVRMAVRDRHGTLFVQTVRGVAWMEDGRFASHPDAREATILLRTMDGSILLSTRGELRTVRADGPEGYRTEQSALPDSGQLGILRYANRSGFEASNGDVYFRSQRRTVRVPLLGDSTYGDPEEVVAGSVIDIAETRDGAVWAGTEYKGLFRILGDTTIHYAAPRGLPGQRIEALLVDYEGNLWISVFGHGVRKLPAFNVSHYTTADGLPADHAQCFFRDPQGRLWIGTLAGAAVLSGSSITALPNPGGLFNETRAFSTAPGNLVYAGTLNALLGPFDLAALMNGARPRRRVIPFGVAGLATLGAPGTLLVGTFGNGLLVADADSVRAGIPFGGLEGTMIEGVVEGSRGPWILTRSRGALRVADTGFVAWTFDIGLPTNGVYSILEPPGGNGTGTDVWIGTDRGLFRHDGDALTGIPESGGFRGSPVLALFRSDRPGRIAPSGRGEIYALTHHALYAVRDTSVSTIQPVSFLRGLRASPNSAFLGEGDSTLWLATTGGVFSFDLRKPPAPPPPPRVVITSVRVAGTDRPIGRHSGSGALALGELAHDQADIDVRFAGLSFGDEQAVRYRTKLVPLDTAFSGPTASRSILFRGLADGPYRLLVVAVNEWNVESAAAAELEFTVLPPFWRRWWFIAAAAGVLLAVAVTAARTSASRKVRSALAEYEKQRVLQEERERISRDLHDHVGGEIAGIITGLDLARRLGGEDSARRGELLDGLRDDARRSMEHLRETIWAMRNPALTLEAFCAEIRRFGGRHFRHFPGVTFTVDSSGDPSAPLHPREVLELFRIIQESIANIVRHATPTRVTASLALGPDGTAALTIENDGAAPRPGDDDPSGGMGLPNMTRRARELGGSLSWEGPAGGTFRVSVSFPRRGEG